MRLNKRVIGKKCGNYFEKAEFNVSSHWISKSGIQYRHQKDSFQDSSRAERAGILGHSLFHQIWVCTMRRRRTK
jgi:hypothetical protein